MDSSSNLWLKHLKDHSIFEQTPKPGYSQSSADFSNLAKKNILILDDFLVLAVGNQIRALRLTLVKENTLRVLKEAGSSELFEPKIDRINSENTIVTSKIIEEIKKIPFIIVAKLAENTEIYKLRLNFLQNIIAVLTNKGVFAISITVSRWKAFYSRVCQQGDDLSVLGSNKHDSSSNEIPEKCIHVGSSAINAKNKSETSKGKIDLGNQELFANQLDEDSFKLASDILWHPLSPKSSHLAVLYPSGSIALYDIINNAMIPEQKLDIFAIQKKSVSNLKQAVSFSIGHYSQNDWDRVSLFVVTNDGDVYCASPFVPKTCVFEKQWVQNMLIQSEVEVEELNSEQYSVGTKLFCPPELQDAITTHEWINYVHNFMLLAQNKPEAENQPLFKPESSLVYKDEFAVLIPDILLSRVKFQGPFLMKPSPPEIIDYDNLDSDSNISDNLEIIDDACDIQILDTKPVAIVAVSYFGGRINLFGLIEPIVPCWELKNPEISSESLRKYPSLFTIESINLSEESKHLAYPVTLSTSFSGPTIFFAGTSTGLYQINVHSWCEELKLRFENKYRHDSISGDYLGSDIDSSSNVSDKKTQKAGLASIMEKLSIKCDSTLSGERGSQITVECLVKLDPTVAHGMKQPFSGIAEVQDLYLSYSLVILINDGTFVGVPMLLPEQEQLLYTFWVSNYQKLAALRKDVSPVASYIPALLSTIDKNQKSLSYSGDAAIASINLFDSTVPALKSGNSVSSAKKSLNVNEDSLYVLGAFAAKLRYNIQSIADSSEEMHNRAEIQQKEFERQKTNLCQIADSLQEFSDNSFEKSLYRILVIKKNQDLIFQKIERMLMLFSRFQESYKSNAESNITNKLHSIEQILSDGNQEMPHNFNQISVKDRIQGIEDVIEEMRTKINAVLSRFNVTTGHQSSASQNSGYGLQLAPGSSLVLDTDFFQSITEEISILETTGAEIIDKTNRLIESSRFSN